jgi:ribosomal protein S18 acetylase RimI-like enzyme
VIRAAHGTDRDAIWKVLEPTIRAGETYALPRDLNHEEALRYWFAPDAEVFVADENAIVGTYRLAPNHQGGGAHVANCGFMTAPAAAGRGIGRAMCAHAIERARARGFRAMQFNFVVSTNERAVRLWESFGFTVVGRLPEAFLHPTRGYVDALVMHLKL